MNSIRRLCNHGIWLEAGAVRLSGPVGDVINAYEASLTSAVRDRGNDGARHRAAQFIRWEIIEPRTDQPNVLDTQDPVTIKVVLEVYRRLRHGAHRISLWNADDQLIWAWATDQLDLAPGTHAFVCDLPGLPIKPGPYTWHVTLHSDRQLVDQWRCVPQMIVATVPLADARDQWSGLLNIPCRFEVCEETP
jgi:hypothetical protein